MQHLRLLLSLLLALSLAACGGSPTTEAPTAAPTAAATHTPRPSPIAEPTAPPTVIPPSVTALATTAPTVQQPPIATLTAELSATVVASLPPTLTPDPGGGGLFPGIEGVTAQPLNVPGGWQPLWVVASNGMGMGDPSQRHFVAIYARDGDSWAELDRAELTNDDYLDPASVTQVEVDPRYVWLEAQGGAGAHSGCYDLLRFDGQRLHSEASSCSSSPGAGGLKDINNDGVPEVVLDATDYYVFCYACGVRLVNYTVLRWDGERMVKLELTPLTESISSELLRLNNLAVEQAQHGLWKDAEATLMQSMALSVQDPIVRLERRADPPGGRGARRAGRQRRLSAARQSVLWRLRRRPGCACSPCRPPSCLASARRWCKARSPRASSRS